MTELRRRMDNDMIIRGMADKTREAYLWAVTGLAKFHRRAPELKGEFNVFRRVGNLIKVS